jgi:hypothetical protein
MKNFALTNDWKSGVFNSGKLKIDRGTVGGCSIEVENEELSSIDSYLYDNEIDRDKDIMELTSKMLITLEKKFT